MPSLRERQREFCDALLRDPAAIDFDLADSTKDRDRILVYRRTVFANYRNALAATYPVVRKLIGTEVFEATVDEFVRVRPSRSGDLNVYGDAFADFLTTLPPTQASPYLPDIARLEWAIDESNRAPDSPCTPEAVLADLASVPGDELPNVRLRLTPTCRIIASEFPIFDIWQDQRRDEQPGRSEFESRQDRLLIRRDSDGVLVQRIEPAEFAWLLALAAHAGLGEAIEQAQVADPAFDLASALHRNIGNRTIAGRDA